MVIKFAVENDGMRIKRDYDNFGFAQFVAKDGKIIFLGHAYRDATLEVAPPAKVDHVVCCYPKGVARNLGLSTIGNWSGETHIRFYTKHIRVIEKNPV